jgi:hypothetical protein
MTELQARGYANAYATTLTAYLMRFGEGDPKGADRFATQMADAWLVKYQAVSDPAPEGAAPVEVAFAEPLPAGEPGKPPQVSLADKLRALVSRPTTPKSVG